MHHISHVTQYQRCALLPSPVYDDARPVDGCFQLNLIAPRLLKWGERRSMRSMRHAIAVSKKYFPAILALPGCHHWV